MTLSLVVQKVAIVATAIRPDAHALAIGPVVQPLAIVDLPVKLDNAAASVRLAILEVSFLYAISID